MYIGLVRHFKVQCDAIPLMSSYDFDNWVMEYDKSDVKENEVYIDHIKWDKCFSSDLPRAIKTSQAIYKEEIQNTELLREVPMSPIFKTKFKLPYVFWCIAGRLAWNFNHKSQLESKKASQRRANEFLDLLENERDINILIVCHSFFMNTLQRELIKRGFKGRYIVSPKNGTLYVYEK